jgi:uncharacterized protein involved in exopolysaccharide biosynthesis
MDELVSQLYTVIRGMWKHRWVGILAAWIVAVIGTIVVLVVPDKYEATARIFVDTQSIDVRVGSAAKRRAASGDAQSHVDQSPQC